MSEIINDIDYVEEDLIVRFKKPYIFEGTSYSEVDLSGLENLRGRDVIEACRKYSRNGNVSVAPQIEIPYTTDIAVRATGLPVEFFENMPANKILKIHQKVLGFLVERNKPY